VEPVVLRRSSIELPRYTTEMGEVFVRSGDGVKGSLDGGAGGRSRLRCRRALSSGMWMLWWVS
jgi:hypothetical protein